MSDWRENPDNIILCEGYHDRAFWSGFLLKSGCQDYRNGQRMATTAAPVNLKGKYTFISPDGSRLITVQPCQGKTQIWKALAYFLSNLAIEPKQRIFVSLDDDHDAVAESYAPSSGCQPLEAFLANQFAGKFSIKGGACLFKPQDSLHPYISIINWASAEPANDNLPGKQTLERLVCAALNLAYPDRAISVKHFLDSRGDGAPAAGVKEFAYSHVAGWFADEGIEGFYRSIWSKDRIYSFLEDELKKIKIWDTMHLAMR